VWALLYILAMIGGFVWAKQLLAGFVKVTLAARRAAA
jgi:hypothetical protein